MVVLHRGSRPGPRALTALTTAIAMLVAATLATSPAAGSTGMADAALIVAPSNQSVVQDPAGSETEAFDPLDPAAFRDSPWWPEYAAMVDHAYTWLDLFRQVGFEKMGSASSDFINVLGGRRLTWTPPPCAECPTYDVWFYGSATGMGLGQRDDWSVPSQIARRAWDEGVRLEVVNRSSPGDQHWQQADRFAWDLSRHPTPDAVVFYTGVSDVNAALYLTQNGLGDVDRPVDTIAETFMGDEVIRGAVDEALRGGEDPPPAPEGVRVPEPDPQPDRSPTEIGELAAQRYGRSLEMSRELVELYGIGGLWIWEPMRLSRPAVTGEPVVDGDEQLRVVVETATERLPDGVADLSRSFADDPRPFFYDDVHHNEEGAEIVGAEVYSLLGALLADGSAP